MNVLDLFSGIGGFSLGLERAGMKTVAFCEIEEYPRKVLKKHWPDVPIYTDVRTLTKEQLDNDGITVDVICGGFPCQDLSVAGKKAGFDGDRSSLYREMLRLVSECRPRYAIFENVTGLLTGESGRWFAQFLYDLAEIGFDAEWHCISASAIGAHHHRDRIWIIAYPNLQRSILPKKTRDNGKNTTESNDQQSQGCSSAHELFSNTTGKRQQGQGQLKQSLLAKAYGEGKTINAIASSLGDIWAVEPELGRVANGIPNRSHRLKALGNAVVPQIPELIGRAIMEIQ